MNMPRQSRGSKVQMMDEKQAESVILEVSPLQLTTVPPVFAS